MTQSRLMTADYKEPTLVTGPFYDSQPITFMTWAAVIGLLDIGMDVTIVEDGGDGDCIHDSRSLHLMFQEKALSPSLATKSHLRSYHRQVIFSPLEQAFEHFRHLEFDETTGTVSYGGTPQTTIYFLIYGIGRTAKETYQHFLEYIEKNVPKQFQGIFVPAGDTFEQLQKQARRLLPHCLDEITDKMQDLGDYRVLVLNPKVSYDQAAFLRLLGRFQDRENTSALVVFGGQRAEDIGGLLAHLASKDPQLNAWFQNTRVLDESLSTIENMSHLILGPRCLDAVFDF